MLEFCALCELICLNLSIILQIPSSNISCHVDVSFPTDILDIITISFKGNGIDEASISEWGQYIDKSLNVTSVSIVIEVKWTYFFSYKHFCDTNGLNKIL